MTHHKDHEHHHLNHKSHGHCTHHHNHHHGGDGHSHGSEEHTHVSEKEHSHCSEKHPHVSEKEHSHCSEKHPHVSEEHPHGSEEHPQSKPLQSEMPINEKIALLLKHWIEHNNSHKDNYLSWADKADEGKFGETAEFLRQASELSIKITESLEKALTSLQKVH
ncbi:MAG: hypothetical protein HQK67_02385 [Desulfamplus sp.]|nr:hypothetical protein [Desulfamplus sp.]